MSLEKRKVIYLTGQGSAEKRIRIMEDEENSDKVVENMSTDCENTLEKERTVFKSYSKTRFALTTLGDYTWEIDQFSGFDEIKNTITFPSFPEIGQCEILMKTFKDTFWDNNTLKEIRFYILTNNSFGGLCTTTVARLSGHVVSSNSISGCISNMALLIVVKSEKLSHENTLIIRCKFEIFRNLIYKNMHMNLRPPLTEISKDFQDSTFDNFSSKDENSIKFVVGEKTYVISRTLLYDTKSRYFQNIALNKARKIYNVSNTFKQILLYIITGSVEQCDYDLLKNLLTAANKYDLPILKLKCEHNLLHYIMAENAIELIQLAFSSNAKFLETNSAIFIKFHRKEITDTNKFQSLSQEDLNKIMELIEEIQIDPVRTYQLSLPLVKYNKFCLSDNTTKT